MQNRKKYGHPKEASIVVSFREEQGRVMHAAFYDHYTIRKITNRNTINAISPPKDEQELLERTKKFADYINDENNIHTLGYGTEQHKKMIPPVSINIEKEGGLVFIPGNRRNPKPGEHYEEREAYEYKLIKDAVLRGRPVLAICGGSWKLWKAFGGELVDLMGHTTSLGMPAINEDGSIGNNYQEHCIELMENTILKGCMKVRSSIELKRYPEVNSIHWAAPAVNELVLKMAQISAVSKEKSDQTNKNNFSSDTIEAFETKFGAPILGIQWHPEAYYTKDGDGQIEAQIECERHLNIIKYMAKSGDAYQAKQLMLQEFKNKLSPAEECIKLGLFSKQNNSNHSLEETHQALSCRPMKHINN